MESVVENTGYSGERKRVSKLRGEVSEGSTSLEASTYILPVNKELVIRWINVGATIEISKGQTADKETDEWHDYHSRQRT